MNLLASGNVDAGRSALARTSLLVGFLLLFVLAGCEGSSRDVREWQASDHDQTPAQPGQVAPPPQGSAQAGSSDQALAELAWQRNCVICHGQRGQGDGPQGPMMRAPDLTRDEWQAQVTDVQITEVIRKGRNRMPAFEALPEQVVTGLVARIRKNRVSP